MLHKIREYMDCENTHRLDSDIGIDKTFIGGKSLKKNNHKDKDDNDKPILSRRISKAPVIGVKEHNTRKVHAIAANYNDEAFVVFVESEVKQFAIQLNNTTL